MQRFGALQVLKSLHTSKSSKKAHEYLTSQNTQRSATLYLGVTRGNCQCAFKTAYRVAVVAQMPDNTTSSTSQTYAAENQSPRKGQHAHVAFPTKLPGLEEARQERRAFVAIFDGHKIGLPKRRRKKRKQPTVVVSVIKRLQSRVLGNIDLHMQGCSGTVVSDRCGVLR